MKLSEALEGYWLEKQLSFSRHTISGYNIIFRRLIAYLDDKEFDQVTSDDIRRFLAYTAAEYQLSRKSIVNIWAALSSLWTWGEVELNVAHVIRGKVKRLRYKTPTVKTFDQDEIKALLEAAAYTKKYAVNGGKHTRNRRLTAGRDKAIIMTLLDTGIRAQELCDLTISDYEEKHGRLHIRRGKGEKQRYVILGNRAKEAVAKYLAGRGEMQPSSPLFATKTEEHLQRDNLRHTLQIIGKQAGVKTYPHKFRHTFAITFLRNGGNVFLLKELLGHESIKMVLYYAHITEQDIAKSVRYSPADNWRL